MIRVSIGEMEHDIGQADEAWVNRSIARYRENKEAVCVKVHIREGDLNFTLISHGCSTGRGGGGGSMETPQQKQAIIDLWRKCHLSDPTFTGGNLVTFLKKVRKLL